MKPFASVERLGDFSKDSFIPIIYNLHSQKFTGELKLDANNDIIRLFWKTGNIKNIWQANTPEPLGRVLFDLGVIDMESYNQSLIKMTQNGERQGKVLMDMGKIDDRQLEKGLKTQLQRKLNRLFFISKGKFELKDEIDDKIADNDFTIPMLSIIFNGMKNAVDEMRLLAWLGSEEISFTLSDDFDAFVFSLPLDEEEVAAISKLRDEISFKDALQKTRLSKTHLGILINYLELLGLVEINRKTSTGRDKKETVKIVAPEKQAASIMAAANASDKSDASEREKTEEVCSVDAFQGQLSKYGHEDDVPETTDIKKGNGRDDSEKLDITDKPLTAKAAVEDIKAEQAQTKTEKEKEKEKPVRKRPITGKNWVRPDSGKYATVASSAANKNKVNIDDIYEFNNEMPKKNYYELLGIRKISSESEIKKAYLNLAKIYHPDNYHDNGAEAVEICGDISANLNKAFNVLSDKKARANYDDRLRVSIMNAPSGSEIEQAEEYYKKGMKQLSSQMALEAENFFKKAIEIAPEESRYFTMLGVTQMAALKRGAGGSDYLLKAEESLAKAIKLDINNADAHYNISQVCDQLGQIDRAIAHAERASSLAGNRKDITENLEFLHKRREQVNTNRSKIEKTKPRGKSGLFAKISPFSKKK